MRNEFNIKIIHTTIRRNKIASILVIPPILDELEEALDIFTVGHGSDILLAFIVFESDLLGGEPSVKTLDGLIQSLHDIWFHFGWTTGDSRHPKNFVDCFFGEITGQHIHYFLFSNLL